MPTTPYTVAADWGAGARYTAATDEDVRITNPSTQHVLWWDVTTDDTPPTTPPAGTNAVKPLEGQPLGLIAGERIWLAGYPGDPAGVVK
ncbi:hypothetical protein RGUI_2780 [Rhodovulum sp. P5]|uniref:hypothetical protein n=1 Tax=Rhodovulum sp. P5 TaxID=1564506 RepID=UPI0009C320FA|nr:hypothetical protein [Rhodovulum sp. P5]ARE40921.1 hypothetical protein RGUI_2780 [Rhodovulum sp. P5]